LRIAPVVWKPQYAAASAVVRRRRATGVTCPTAAPTAGTTSRASRSSEDGGSSSLLLGPSPSLDEFELDEFDELDDDDAAPTLRGARRER
jgi:hypothetical protein